MRVLSVYITAFIALVILVDSGKTVETIPPDILNALAETFEYDPDSLARIIFFLSTSVAEGVGDPYINSLQSVLQQHGQWSIVFRRVAERMAEDTKTAEKDPNYKQFMQDIWSNFLKDDFDENSDDIKTWALALKEAVKSGTTLTGSVAVWDHMALSYAGKSAPAVKNTLVAIYLSYDVAVNIRRWYRGEITGVRCVKNIIDNGVGVAAGVTGAIGGEAIGAAIGSSFGPLGTGIGAVTGAMAGAFIGATTAQTIMDRLTQWFFGLPKSEALENAYVLLGLSSSASNSEVNRRYRQLARQHHPDKGGDQEKWMLLQYSMAIIKEARNE